MEGAPTATFTVPPLLTDELPHDVKLDDATDTVTDTPVSPSKIEEDGPVGVMDVNEDSRNRYFYSCMKTKGWDREDRWMWE